MPTYEYGCEGCGHEMELFQNISESPKRKCPACKKLKLKRKIGGGAGFLFKGSGFYLTDYRSDSYRKGADADSKPASDSKGSDKGAESKASPPSSSSTPSSSPSTPAPQPPKKKKTP